MTDPGFEPRVVPLTRGRSLLVREMRTDDVDALLDLYARLGAEDRYRRFFSSGVPPRAWIERMVALPDRGGFGLVVHAADDGAGDASGPAGATPSAPLVAEATYALLDNGDGELAITVAPGWRGWLGAYLLDVLLEVAAERGIPNLEADILTTNRSMLALARSRGYVTTSHDGWNIVRVMIGAADREPHWPGPHDRPRILVEAPGGRWVHEGAARAAGLQVVVCPGPTSRRRPCPAMTGEPCSLAAGADAVVVAHPLSDWPDLVSAHRAVHPEVPVCLQPRRGDEAVPDVVRLAPADEDAVVTFLRHLAAGDAEPDPGLGGSLDPR
jgi:GNAT superfamily N-acetyltransferase